MSDLPKVTKLALSPIFFVSPVDLSPLLKALEATFQGQEGGLDGQVFKRTWPLAFLDLKCPQGICRGCHVQAPLSLASLWATNRRFHLLSLPHTDSDARWLSAIPAEIHCLLGCRALSHPPRAPAALGKPTCSGFGLGQVEGLSLFPQSETHPLLSQAISSIEAGETRIIFYKHWCLVKCVTLGSLMLLKSLSAGSLLVLTSHFFLLLTLIIRRIAWVQDQCFQDLKEQQTQTCSARPWNHGCPVSIGKLLKRFRNKSFLPPQGTYPLPPSTWLHLHHTCTLHP